MDYACDIPFIHSDETAMTIRTLLERAVANRPHRIALRYRRHGVWLSRTYAELSEGVRQMAEGFGRLGVKPGEERVAVILENGPEWLEAYLALAGAGVQVVPLDPKLQAEEVSYILGNAGAVLVLTDKAHRGLLEAVLPGLSAVRTVVLTDCGAEPVTPVAGRACHGYESLRDGVSGSPRAWYDAHRAAPQDVASIIYTSGTTGRPKGAMLTHNNFCSDVAGALDAIGTGEVTAADDFLVVLPLFHSFSFIANFVLPLFCGCGMFFVESLRTMGRDIRILRPTILMAVPLLAEKLLYRIDDKLACSGLARFLLKTGLGRLVGRLVLRSLGGRLRFLVVGGAPCPVHVLSRFGRLGITIIEGYGLTECSPVVSINSLHAPRVGSIGKKITNVEIRVAEADGQGVGELQVRGPVVMKGYFQDLEATREAFDGEWLRTGDLASVDAEGFITICGRKKALIVNREGKNIYPEEVENVIARDPLVADVVVVGYTIGGVPGERVGAIIAPCLDALRQANGGEEPAWGDVEHRVLDAVHRQCESLAEYKHPRKIVVQREPLERTSVQKVRRCVYQGTLNE
jgi:long-chain acyl-CoA synthetase